MTNKLNARRQLPETAIFKTFVLLLLASAMTLGTTVEAKNPNPTPCTFSNKVRSNGLTQVQWDQLNAINRKFVNGYVIEKQRYDKFNPINRDRLPSKGKERRNFFHARGQEIDRAYKNKIMTEDPNFYRIIENGPDGWNYTEKDKEVWRHGLWENFASIGYYKEEIMSLADTGKYSLAHLTTLTKTWSVGSSREAARIKKMTLGLIEDERSYLHKQIKRLDSLVCRGAWFSSWFEDIYDEATKAYLKIHDVQNHNATVVDQERNKTLGSSSSPSCPLIWNDRYRAYDDCVTRLNRIYRLNVPFGVQIDTCGGPPLDVYKPCR